MKQQRRTIRDIAAAKGKKEAIICLTAYTAPVARLADPHADLILVGDSLGMVLYGFPSTLPVTLDMMILHGRAVVNASEKSLIVVDMPFGSYQESPAQAFHNAARIMAETGCAAVKLEGGSEMAETVSFLVQRGVPVIGHIGLQPQSVHSAGGYRVAGRDQQEARSILASAQALAEAGAFAVVLECMDETLAGKITKQIHIPTIGIGASAGCDGQILVSEDLLGLTPAPRPKFVKNYADLSSVIDKALGDYAREVRERIFPGTQNIYMSPDRKIRAVE